MAYFSDAVQEILIFQSGTGIDERTALLSSPILDTGLGSYSCGSWLVMVLPSRRPVALADVKLSDSKVQTPVGVWPLSSRRVLSSQAEASPKNVVCWHGSPALR